MADRLKLITNALILLLGVTALSTGTAHAQNTSSVSGPTVSAGERQVEYRLGWTPVSEGGDRFAHRFDYGASINERSRFKVFATFSNRAGESLSFNNINAEYVRELTPEGAPVWQSAIRFDARLSDGPSSERVRVNWLNQWRLNDAIRARAQLIAARRIGANASSAIEFDLRASLNWDLGNDYDLSLLSFNPLGTHDDFGLSRSEKQLGPTISGPLPNGLRWTAGTLFGVSDEAPDHDLRFWLSKEF